MLCISCHLKYGGTDVVVAHLSLLMLD